ncbi:putative ABC transport system permease protein [Salirhabdus euzebyi]|uniref:Putative ABC transport system permease protein n=1 Tax=Salirhabdus euzebyi TaxID=394506 RepID=A0A841Q357_9BACI|nr:ABC transporter permease [Salirhabdus euzebyi]MBB6452648.1 putative ABC transport system permease protein [Salirhabdus euzebyi]
MNIVNKLTLRHLKQNKKRTLVTIIGTIISVAMITAVATLAISFMDLMQRQTIAQDGEWHVLYYNVNSEQLEALEDDKETDKVVISKDRGYALLEGSKNEYKPYLFVKQYNAAGFEQFPVTLKEGRLPQAANEVVVSEHIKSNGGVEFAIRDTVELEVGKRYLLDSQEMPNSFQQFDPLQVDEGEWKEGLFQLSPETYKIVGVVERPSWEPTWAPGYTIISYLDEAMIGADEKVQASVVLKDVNRNLYDHAKEVAEHNNIEKYSFNNQLLRFYGVTNNNGLQTTLYSLSAIIMTVIVIGSVALIYNAFGISVSERSRHLGMLSSVGATKKQKRNSVFFEGVVIGAISIPIGIIAGIVGIGVTFWYINSIIQGALGIEEKLQVVITPFSILVACLVSMITIFISTYIPARRASKISAIDAIRQTQDIKLTEKAVKTSSVVRKIFGIEAEIGLKNLKRNKRRYRTTVFSLVISIILFLTVSYFTDNLKKVLELSQDGVNYDIQVLLGSDQQETDLMKESILSLENITEYTYLEESDLATWIEEEAISDIFKKNLEHDRSILKDGKYPYGIHIKALNLERLEAYAKEIGVEIEHLQDPENIRAIVVDTVPYEDYEAGKIYETKVLHTEVGEHLELYSQNWETGEYKLLKEIEIGGLTDKLPMGITPGHIGGITMIISEEVLQSIIADVEKVHVNKYLYLNSKDPMKTQEQIEEIQEGDMHVYNVYQARQQEEQLVLLMSVFTYGFITLITIISIANIFNTISTSISLRKREFAMLKSVGMTPKSFNKMINYESIFYGIKSLLYGLPLSFGIMYLIYKATRNTFYFGFLLPWTSIGIVIIAVFMIVGSAMLYSISKVKKENIIEALKQENV